MPAAAKPTHLKVLQSTGGKLAGHGKRNRAEPRPKGNLFEAPAYLSAEQRDLWTYAIANAPAGLLKRLDSSVLETWVKTQDVCRRAMAELEAADKAAKALDPSGTALIEVGTNGRPSASPYINIFAKMTPLMLKAASELGFSPVSRTRISLGMAPDQEATNEFDDV